jgi:hypothetical protein
MGSASGAAIACDMMSGTFRGWLLMWVNFHILGSARIWIGIIQKNGPFAAGRLKSSLSS